MRTCLKIFHIKQQQTKRMKQAALSAAVICRCCIYSWVFKRITDQRPEGMTSPPSQTPLLLASHSCHEIAGVGAFGAFFMFYFQGRLVQGFFDQAQQV